MSLPILYTFRRCPYAMRARLALHVARVAFEAREVELASKPASLLRASPKGTVPVMLLPNGEVLEESLDIMRWALAANDPDRWLTAGDARQGDQWIAINDTTFKRHLDRYKYPSRYEGADSNEERALACDVLAPLETALSRAPWLGGERRALCDAAIFPFVRQFAQVQPHWFADAFPHLEAWRNRWQSDGLFEVVMQKYPTWHDLDEAAKLPSC